MQMFDSYYNFLNTQGIKNEMIIVILSELLPLLFFLQKT